MNTVATLQDVERIEQAGLATDPPASTYEAIARGAAIDPQAPALSFFLATDAYRSPETWSYAELLGNITRTANFFHSLGVQKDDVIAYVLPNLPETHFTVWGGEAAGIVAAINPLLEPVAIAQLLNAAGAKVLVTLAPFPGTDLWDKMQTVVPNVPGLSDVVLVNLADHVPGVPAGAGVTLPDAALPADVRVHDFGSAVAGQPEDRLVSERTFQREDFSSFFCTGGTTGLPKIAMRRHGNEVSNAWSAAQFFGEGMGPGTTLFCGLPMFHVNAVLVTGLLPFSVGAHVVLGTPGGYRGEGVIPRFWEIVEHYSVNFFSAVPTLYATLLQVPQNGHDVSSLQYGICGAAPLPVEVMRTFEERTGIRILEGYGLTEGTCVSSINPPRGERRPGSIGIRIPGQDMKAVILDDDGAYQRDCATDEVGALLVRGANVFAGYKEAEQNKGLWVDTGDGQPWMNTGDLGRQDAEGYFYLTGRKKELIIRGGHNIDPQTIEEPLHQHPAVQVAAAVGRPDAHAGELPVAYVQLHEGAEATEAELLAFCQDNIRERAAQPKRIRIIGEMPLTGVGKIFKPALKRAETREAIEEALREVNAAFLDVDVEDDKSKGLVIHVRLAPGTPADAAQAALGRYPFPYTVS